MFSQHNDSVMGDTRVPSRQSPAAENSVSREVLQFAIPGFVALIVLAVASYLIAQRVAEEEALRDATAIAEVMARASVEPYLADADLSRSVGLSELDALARERLLMDPVVAVRMWTPDGTVAYATDPALIGLTFGLGEEEVEILRDGGTEAEVSDLTKPENASQQGFGELVEVYLPVQDGRGRTYLFEVYTRQSAIDEQAQRIMSAFMPLLIGSLVVLTGILILLAWRMASRARRDARRREELLHRALDSSETERRRIAADLHDGVVQDLAGVTYSLAGLAEQVADPRVATGLRRNADTTRHAVRGLRSLLVDIYPPSLAEAGLTAALTDLLSSLPDGTAGTLAVSDDVSLDDEQQAAVYRAARETLQNVAKHAAATSVHIDVSQRPDGTAVLVVTDDGRGFDPAGVAGSHFGLALLRDLAASSRGDFQVHSEPGAGTRITFEVPR